jgi:hypothetical protein
MGLCPVWVQKTIAKKVTTFAMVPMATGQMQQQATGQNIVPTKKTVVCGKKQEIFVRVHYKDLKHYHRRSGKFDDVFGLCRDHTSLAHDVKIWQKSDRGIHEWHGGACSGIRGVVDRVEVVQGMDPAVLARQDKTLRVMATAKSNFKRIMVQDNVSSLSVDNWRQLMEECIEEWVTEGVMNS